MSSFLCFICHNIVHCDTNEMMREKYREVIGMQLCQDNNLCFVCCHMVNKMWLFKSICMKRSLEYPVLFSEKGTLHLQTTYVDIHNLCPIDDCVDQYNICMDISKSLHHNHHNYDIDNENNDLNISHVELTHNNEETVVDNDNTEVNAYFKDDITNYTPQQADKELTVLESSRLDIENTENTAVATVVQNDNYYGESNINTEQPQNNNSSGNENIHNYSENEEMDHVDTEEHKTVDLNKYDEEITEEYVKKKKVKAKKGFKKVKLSIDEQKTELEARRKDKKYLETDFRCYNCALGFLFKDTYQAHMMRHEESNGVHLCNICLLRFASAAVLRSHVRLHEDRLRCKRCQAVVAVRHRDKHSRECQSVEQISQEAPCHLCAKIFKDSTRLQQHLKRFHWSRTRVRTYSCSVCGNNYTNQAAVRTHMIKHINRKFQCEQCPATFSSPYTLRQHTKKHSSPPEHHACSCGQQYSSYKSLLAHRRNSLQHQFTLHECSSCGVSFSSRRALARHSAIHVPPATLAGVSSAPRATRTTRRRHAAATATPPAVCHLCGNSFSGNNKLRRHLREVCEKNKLEEQIAALYDEDALLN